MAGEGLPFYVWSKMAAPGQSPWDVGRQRAMRETGSFSYRNAIVREEAGEIVACLIAYGLKDDPASSNHSQIPPMFAPLQQLEDMAAGTWYVNVVATYPGHRGRGHGQALMAVAENAARKAGYRGLSLVVADANVTARRLYEGLGYAEEAQLPMEKEDWQHPGSNWVLYLKAL